jgi:anaerobic ribonucleoside-triphosphate reductase activating protein
MSETLRIHHLIEKTRANGPGLRAALWTQGCSLGCKGCFNPATHPFHGGELVGVDELARRITAIGGIAGLSILGGEPLQQPQAVFSLLRMVKATSGLSVILFTGFTLEEIAARMPGAEELSNLVDVLIAGRYEEDLRLARGLRGSRNKTVTIFSDRYSEDDLEAVPACEITVDAKGEITINGMDPLVW